MTELSRIDLDKFFSNGMRPKLEYDEVAHRARTDNELFEALWNLVKVGKQPVAWRAAWVLDHATEEAPGLIAPILDEIYSMIPTEKSDSSLRHLMKLLLRRPLDIDKAGYLVDHCIGWVLNPKDSVSKRVLGLQLLFELYLLEPDFGNELQAIIAVCEERGGTRGFFNRLGKVKQLVK